MDSIRFDTLVKHLYQMKNRREGLRALVAGVVAGLAATTGPERAAANDCLGRDRSCRKNADCCSGICEFRPGRSARQEGQADDQRVEAERNGRKGKQARKGKNKRNKRKTRRGDPRGGCDCSALQEKCNERADCCEASFFCAVNGCEPHRRCCKAVDAPCVDDCDCCGDMTCGEDSGRCEEAEDCGELKETQEPCQTTDDCCFETDVCESIDPTCFRREGNTQCCVPEGQACREDCDCCLPTRCQGDGTCHCASLRHACESSHDCCVGTICDLANEVCCLPEGRPCTAGGDCCPGLQCLDAAGDGTKACVPSRCAPGQVECPLGSFQPCCPQGSACSAVGCLTDEPRACPAGADTCARPLVFCSEKNNRLNCACYLDLAGNPFCSSGRSPCDANCTSDAECDDPERGIVGSRCIRCPGDCGHNDGVCASPCFEGL